MRALVVCSLPRTKLLETSFTSLIYLQQLYTYVFPHDCVSAFGVHVHPGMRFTLGQFVEIRPPRTHTTVHFKCNCFHWPIARVLHGTLLTQFWVNLWRYAHDQIWPYYRIIGHTKCNCSSIQLCSPLPSVSRVTSSHFPTSPLLFTPSFNCMSVKCHGILVFQWMPKRRNSLRVCRYSTLSLLYKC